MKNFEDFKAEFGEETEYNLNPERLSDRDRLLNRCKERCLYLITDSEKTEQSLRTKLKKSGKYPDEIIDETMEFLKKYDYLNDLRYAEHLIRLYRGSKSLREIEQKLYQRGVDRETIKEAMQDFRETEGTESEMEAVRLQIRKKVRDVSAMTAEERRKLYASLMRKGFSYSVVTKALELDQQYE